MYGYREYKELGVKGFTVKVGDPRSRIVDAIEPVPSIDPAIGPSNPEDHVVVHVADATSSAARFAGVYSPIVEGRPLRLSVGRLSDMNIGYRRNLKLTKEFMNKFGRRKNRHSLKDRGYCFDLNQDNKPYGLVGFPNKTGKHNWYIFAENGPQYVEASLPRSRDKKFWQDPDSLIFVDPNEVHSAWIPMDTKKEVAVMGITPLVTVRRLLMADLSVPRNVKPPKYEKAVDFSVWNRSFVLHADPRSCLLPAHWLNPFLGVYTPVKDTLFNGYPVWERQAALTIQLSRTSLPVEKHLVKQGISFPSSHFTGPTVYLFVGGCDGGSQSALLSAQLLEDMQSIAAERKHTTLVGHCIPDEIESILSDPSFFYANPDKAYASWAVRFGRQFVDLYMGFTPQAHFRKAIALASLEADVAVANEEKVEPSASSGSKKKKKKRKKKKKTGEAEAESQAENAANHGQITDDNAEVLEAQAKLDKAHESLRHLAKIAGADSSSIPSPKQARADADDGTQEKQWGAEETLVCLFGTEESDPMWTLMQDQITAPILEKALESTAYSAWLKTNASRLVILLSEKMRQDDMIALLNVGVTVSGEACFALLSGLTKDRGAQFNNKIIKILCEKCLIETEAANEDRDLKDIAYERIGKATRKELAGALKRASAHKLKAKKSFNSDSSIKAKEAAKIALAVKDEEEGVVESNAANTGCDNVDPFPPKDPDIKQAAESIQSALSWYVKELDRLVDAARFKIENKATNETEEKLEDDLCVDANEPSTGITKKPKHTLTSEQVVAALSNCDSEEVLENVEMGIDLFQWDNMSEWTIDITEQAHKWFNRHKKKDRALCERVLLRLILLSTGRWPYVLCKPLKSRSLGTNGKKISLYETKIDKAGRIVWEVALAFSPRRSSLEQNFCEQVIRVWDIVLDHDNLARSIDLTIERIEKSHMRGEECALFAEIDRTCKSMTNPAHDGIRIPRVWPMSNEVKCVGSSVEQTTRGKSRHFHPASDDLKQFTLLKFYELNAGAVKMLLDGQDENMDLPFTPGPKEHEIIHYQSNPQRSILLMGRSGTGKTTCLVFRMWAQYAQYMDGHEGVQPRQVFLTKNDILCREVERSFNNMGLAWRKRLSNSKTESNQPNKTEELDTKASLTKFLTSSEWLDALEVSLPGEQFFTPHELEQRVDTRKQKDSVSRGVEALLGDTVKEKDASSYRSEMTFEIFRKLWRKIRSGSGSQMECTLVWREIKSFIKGSVPALHIGQQERLLPQNRFLSLEEYLSLPRKQSRMDDSQRREIYQLYQSYEKLKKESNYYDECDLVYNIAGRISLVNNAWLEKMTAEESLLPVDSLYVDEVQDFTQAELFILAKLCRNPDNLFLAGDTAQSIAVGVDFRFTDVRQIFYNHFGGIEPKLLQLSHNYRSHAGVLRLAASVVELLYFFFSNSLDKLPPDLGLFSGPKPVIMEVTSTADLVLMLEGAKRETSRIEFGAHQVVLVRSEEAKQNLPDEFGVDRDWVMTVQQAKGLEFDDVLLYNFFSDSPAGDLWRVVLNYTEKDIAEYYADATVVASGVQQYEWTSHLLLDTRHLEFSADQHKILETELKILYTAITRARVNIFIAETNVTSSKPMFNYFQRRCVVDVVSRPGEGSGGLNAVRVFGVEENKPQEWRSRGEYYLKMAEGERQIGCLRLAAKCFDRAKDEEKKKIALAYLAFTEMEEQQENYKKKGKQGAERKEKLYNITAQLLEARDVGFLDKAALCLLRTGDHNEEAGKIFELYARLCFTERLYAEKGHVDPLAPSTHEKKFFSFAAKLFARCHQRGTSKSGLPMASFRNFVCAEQFDEANLLLNSGMVPLQIGSTFVDLHQQCMVTDKNSADPIAHFQDIFKKSSDKPELLKLKDSIKRAASIGCRKLYMSDAASFHAALELIPEQSDRIKLLSSIDQGSPDLVLSKQPWSTHYLFRKDGRSDGQKVARSQINIADMLVRELDSGERFREAAEMLENRGFLLEAAERYDRLQTDEGGSPFLASRATELRVRYVELMLLTSKWQKDKETLIMDATLPRGKCMAIPIDTKYSSLYCRSMLGIMDKFQLLPEFTDSVMWQYRLLDELMSTSSHEKLLHCLPGENAKDRLNFIYKIALELKALALALRRKPSLRRPEENTLCTHAEGYFDLAPTRMDPTHLETNPFVNLRLREVVHSLQCSLPTVSRGGFTSSKQVVDREEIGRILSKHMFRKLGSLLLELNDMLLLQEKTLRGVAEHDVSSMQAYIDCLQTHMACIKTMSTLHHGDNNKLDPWVAFNKKISEGKVLSPKRLVDTLLSETKLHFAVDGQPSDTAKNAVTLKNHAIIALKDFIAKEFFRLPVLEKKQEIKHIINHWRLLSFCSGESDASEEIRREVKRLERLQSTKNDFWKKRSTYFINKSKQEIYPRLWLWAVECAQDEIMNSVSLVERMIRTSNRDGLVSFGKYDQLAFLEVNSIVVFGALSLRYSEISMPPLIFLPKDLYFERLLARDGRGFELDGFGVPLSQAILAYCHKHFDVVFENCVSHLETTADIMLNHNLLFRMEGDEGAQLFEKALHLGVFLCCNAVVFSALGTPMGLHEYKRDPSTLPSVPLQGNIKKLVGALRRVFVEKLYPSAMEKYMANLPNTLLDLAIVSEQILKRKKDNHVLCKLQQESEDEISLKCSNHFDQVSAVLARVQFDDSAVIFMNWTEASTFLNDDCSNDAEDELDDDDHGRMAEELNAGRVIAHFIESKMTTNTSASTKEKVDMIAYFRVWKSTMRTFIELIQTRAKEKKTSTLQTGNSELISCNEKMPGVLEMVQNPFQDIASFHYHHQNIMALFNSAIVDHVECTYCVMAFDPATRQARFDKWDVEGRRVPFPQFVQQYNQGMRGPMNNLNLTYHAHSPGHYDNIIDYNQKLGQFATVMARIRLGLWLLREIIAQCDQVGQNEDATSSWYLHTAEEAREMVTRHGKAENDLSEAGVIWSRLPQHTYVWKLLDTTHRLPQEAECFFLAKVDEEARMKRAAIIDSVEEEEEEEAANSILNPSAPSFIPQFNF